MTDTSDSPDDRRRLRRSRRWARRVRIIAPFAGVPLLLATLVVSVGLIEYKPQSPRAKLSSRPLPTPALDARREQLRRDAIATASQHQPAVEGEVPGVVAADPLAIDLEQVSTLPPRPPTGRFAPAEP